MQAVLIKHQAIAQGQTDIREIGDAGAIGCPLRTQISPVGMFAGLQVGHTQRALLACCAQLQTLVEPAGQLSAAPFGLAPGDLAVAVGIEVKHQVHIAQMEVGSQSQRPRWSAQRQVTVAAGMRQGRARTQQGGHEDPQAEHRTRLLAQKSVNHGRSLDQLG